MGLRDTRTLDSFTPRRGRDQSNDRRQTPQVLFGTVKFTKDLTTRPIPLWRAPSGVKIIRVSIIVGQSVASANESFWAFQLFNITANRGLNAVPQTTTLLPITADKAYDILADTGSTVNDVAGGTVVPTTPATIPTQIMKQNDVLALLCTKTGSPATLTNLNFFIEYEVTGLTTTTSSSTTVTTSTSTSSSSSSSTSTSTTTSTTTSSSTTSTSTSSTTTTTVSSSSSSSTSTSVTTSTSTSISTSSTTSITISSTSTLT